MKTRRYLALILAVAVALSCVVIPTYAASSDVSLSAGENYGTAVSNADGSTTLLFGEDSITTGGGGSVGSDADNPGYSRPDNLKTDASGNAVLTLAAVDLNNSGYDKIDLYAASAKDAAVSVKVGDVEIASFANVNNGEWHTYSLNTQTLKTTQASGNLTLNITGAANTYCGNYVYVKLYNSGAPAITNPPATEGPTIDPNAPTATPKPTVDPSTILPYQNESLSFEERAADLVSRMTLEEKIAQLGYQAPAIERLGVSAYNYWRECLHGVARQGKATSFPTSLSLSNTWNTDLIFRVADITSTEARAKNNRYNLSYYTPTINMARDPRWGRNEETYGEDPYLTGQIGAAFVKGMQGDDEKYTKIIATIKHFAANNNEANRRGGTSIMNEFNFRNYYLRVFQNVTEEVMPGSVMSSYNGTSIYRNGSLIYNYLPSSANSYLLTDMLRRNWGFSGYVTTDCGCGEDIVSNAAYRMGILGTGSAADEAYIAAALKAGMDVECNLGGGNYTTKLGVAAVENGYISEEEVETNVYHLFLQRFKTGEFDETSTYRDINSSILESDENVAVAEEAAEESWVLLKNDDNTLPIKDDVTNVAVVGNMANVLAVGDYKGSPTKTVKPIEGIKQELGGKGIEVSYLGEITDDEKLFNVKSITLVFKDGSTKALDLSKAESVSGMTYSDGKFIDVTPTASAVIKNVDFVNVAKVRVEMATGSRIGGSLNIAYGQGGPGVAAISSQATADLNTYVACEADYTGEDGGYNGTADMYISASPTALDFSVENYKAQLDAADVIIAYAGTVPKQDDLGDADSSESKDRANIDLPSHQAHVQNICNAYPDKTVVVMSTVGQINVEPFMNKCKAILWTSYNGQTQGTALGKVLTGEVNPSGKLSTTWYKNSDVNKMELANKTKKTIDGINGYYTDYDIQADGTNPGHTYQYYTGTPVYPFGYGLSYTDFEYSNAKITNVDTAVLAAGDTDGAAITDASVQNGNTVVTLSGITSGVVIAAKYNGSVMTDYKTADVKSGAITIEGIEADKVMVWDSLDTMKPLCAAKSTNAYENPTVDPNGSVTFSVDVTNTGSVAGKEVVQLYVAHPNAGEDNMPAKQLKGFVKTQLLQPGETETVEIELNVRDMYLFSEADQKDFVPEGGYTAYIAKNANDTSIAETFEVTGTLASELKTVKAVPDGVSLNGLIREDGTALESVTNVKANLSAVMSDEVFYDLANADVKYESSNSNVATVDANGTVSSGATEGVATITCTVTIDGVTKTDSFPVVNKLEIKPSAEEVSDALAQLKAAYDKLPKAAYSATNLAEIDKIYSHGVDGINAAATKTELNNVLAEKINNMNSVAMDNLTEKYSLSSVNPTHIEKGTIDYREGGIPMYDGASGTITNVNPYSGIQMQISDESGNTVDASKFVWQIKKFDNSVRKVADIDSETGELTVYGNGIIQITAANTEELTCGTLMVHVNMQIEGEYADNANGADLTDAQSGSSGGHDAGSTGTAWMEYKSVKLSNLESIVARYAGKNAGIINISLAKDSGSDYLVATANATATGAWNTWSDVNLTLNSETLYNAQLNGLLDDYGCATIYVQTNGTNLDYFRLNYIENNDDEPYTINKILNKTDGRMKVTLGYRGSTLATDVTLTATIEGKTPVTATVKGTGEYEIATGAAEGETVSLVVSDASGNPLSQTVEQVWKAPVDSEIVVYSLDSTGFDYSVLTGGTDKNAYDKTVNGLSGYGAWIVANQKTNYTYSDVNEKTYDFSFTKAWQAGAGSTTNRCLYFTPKAPCKVTALFQGGEAARSMTIYQSDDVMITQPGTGSVKDFSLEITDTTKPVYVYGGSSNKQLYAIIVEYYGQ